MAIPRCYDEVLVPDAGPIVSSPSSEAVDLYVSRTPVPGHDIPSAMVHASAPLVTVPASQVPPEVSDCIMYDPSLLSRPATPIDVWIPAPQKGHDLDLPSSVLLHEPASDAETGVRSLGVELGLDGMDLSW